jgi:CDP-paratose 2-epimerase
VPVGVVTGAGGLVGSAAVRRLIESGFEVVGFENDMRARLFGADASTEPTARKLAEAHPELSWQRTDIRDAEQVNTVFAQRSAGIEIVNGGCDSTSTLSCARSHEANGERWGAAAT